MFRCRDREEWGRWMYRRRNRDKRGPPRHFDVEIERNGAYMSTGIEIEANGGGGGALSVAGSKSRGVGSYIVQLRWLSTVVHRRALVNVGCSCSSLL